MRQIILTLTTGQPLLIWEDDHSLTVHELRHLVEHHHGPAFYALLTRVLPDEGG
nr:M48 family metallopeptidase [Anaerolineae bacterium]